MKAQVTYNFDVWGNCYEGYDVNNSRLLGEIEIEEKSTDEEILAAICDEFDFYGDKSVMEFENYGDALAINETHDIDSDYIEDMQQYRSENQDREDFSSRPMFFDQFDY